MFHKIKRSTFFPYFFDSTSLLHYYVHFQASRERCAHREVQEKLQSRGSIKHLKKLVSHIFYLFKHNY